MPHLIHTTSRSDVSVSFFRLALECLLKVGIMPTSSSHSYSQVIEMAKNTPQALSEAQQEIMEIIWDRGELSVSEVWDVLQERRDVARNTVQTMIVRI